jgi:membrane fusion protein, multidrug efflux system
MSKRAATILIILCSLGIFVGVVGVLAFLKQIQIGKGMAMGAMMAPQPSAVSTVQVQPQPWEPVLNAVGTMRAVNGTTLSTELAGIVSKIAFESGTSVKKGDLLVELDSQQEIAQLHAEEAKLQFAKIDLNRKRDLIEKKAISSSDLDTAETSQRQSEAMVQAAQAVIGRKRIIAPFDGIIGIRQVSLGQYLNPGTVIAPLQSIDPIYVEFALPQQHLGALNLGRKLRVSTTGVEESFEGEITAVDSRVDEATRNITVQGTIANAEGKLRPGMFVNVDVLLPAQENVLSVPLSSINYATYGDSVFVITDGQDQKGKPSKVVDQRTVKLGVTRGDRVAILSGLQAGDEVVTSGVFRLQKGAAVQVNNSVQPGNDLNPHPAES